MENTIKKIISFGIDGEKIEKFVSLLQREEHPKGHLLIREGKLERSLFFLEKGIARAFTQTEDKDITFWFGAEGEVLLSMQSYLSNLPGYESIEFLEKSEVLKISYAALLQLYEEDIDMANWGRRFAESELIKAEQRYISRQFKTASERYEDFVSDFPEWSKRIQLGHIASYLGVSQVTLSRIRAERR